MNGLTEIFDVSPDGMIAYVAYHEGQQHIVLKTEREEQLALDVNKEKVILDIAFSPDGSSLVYAITGKDIESELLSTVNVLDIDSLSDESLFQKDGIIAEVAFDPKDENQLFYLKADTYENYSPIARANPHDFDIYSYYLPKETHTEITNFEKYSMNSLQVSSEEEAVYIQMFDDALAETAEDIFDAQQKIFKVPLESPETLSVISDPKKEIDIYDFAMLPDEEKIVYQSISNAKSGGTFQYELYLYDSSSNDETQLTNLQQYAASPVIAENYIYFITDFQFAGKHPDYRLYKIDLNGENPVEIELEFQ